MRKNLIFCTLAIMAMFGFTACDNDCDHNFIEVDYSKALVGTWTCIEPENEFAEALKIKADGTMEVTGVVNGEFYETTGTIHVKNNKVSYKQENGDEFEGRFEMVAGKMFSLVFDADLDLRFTYHYCENDLSDEIIGMWVCNDGPFESKDDMIIQTFNEDGSVLFTGYSAYEGGYTLNGKGSYKVIGDMLFHKLPNENLVEGVFQNIAKKLVYTPNATDLGDVMTLRGYLENGEQNEFASSFLRVKQDLELTGNKYEYNSIYVSNVKGLDKEMEFMGFKLNFAEADGANIDKALKALLFNAEFPNENTIKYSCRHSGNNVVTVEAPIVVEGNKMTVKVSEVYAGLKDVDLYCFQDADNCQLHMYMPTYSFVNFFGNMQIMMMSQAEQFDVTDAAAVKAVYDSVDKAVESINISFVMKAAK